MPEGMATLGIDAGRQTPAHEQLSRMLWLRKRGEVFRFILDPASDPGLTLERIGPAASRVMARVPAATAGGTVDSGLVLVDGEDGLAFCTRSDPREFLQRLARYAAEAIAAVPALALLADSGAGPLTIDPADDAAAKAYVPDGARVVYEPDLWTDLLRPDIATTAAALAAVTPGERMWFWLAEDEVEGALPLILQPVAWDPNHDRTNWLIDRNSEIGAGEGLSGTAMICDDGRIQFLGGGLYREMLIPLAHWVARNVAEYPALGRLVDCQLVASSGGSVEAVIADPHLWADVSLQPVPGTIHATAAVLETLPVGGECWFWITGGTSDPPFLHLVSTADDPDGKAFQAALPRLFKRFSNAFGNAIVGVLSRAAANRMLCSTQDQRVQQFPAQVASLLGRYGDEFPALRVLAGATLLQAGPDGNPRVAATA